MSQKRVVFECVQCGHCCEGRGGIVLSEKDLHRLSSFLHKTEEETKREYAEVSNGKLKIRCDDDGKCVFFRADVGCSVHDGKPDICRAWPFFKGNLEDPISLAMAADFCPGIAKNVDFELFVAEGMKYLYDNDLIAKDEESHANSLIVIKPKKIF